MGKLLNSKPKVFKRIFAVFTLVFCLMFQFILLKPTKAFALSEPGSNTLNFDDAITTPYNNMLTFSNGISNVNNNIWFTANSYTSVNNFMNRINIGGSTVEFIHDDTGIDIMTTREDALEHYLTDPQRRKGVLTTTDGFVVGDHPYSNRYYDNSSSEYVFNQTYNSSINEYELTSYYSYRTSLQFSKPSVVYVNDLVTDFNIKTGFIFNTRGNDINSAIDKPTEYLKEVGLEHLSESEVNPNMPTYCYTFADFIDYFGLSDTWESYGKYLEYIIDYTCYLRTDIYYSFVAENGEYFERTASFEDYNKMYIDYNGAYAGKSIIPLNTILMEDINNYALMREYCVMFDSLDISVTAYCDNGTYEYKEDDFVICVPTMFIDLPFYNYTDTIDTQIIMNSQDLALKQFIGEIYSDRLTFLNFISEIFDLEIIKGFKLSYLISIALGATLIILFIRFFR